MAKAAKKTAWEKLSLKHKAFLMHFCRHFNATRAYRDAGYSENAAHVSSSQLLAKPSIQAALKEILPAALSKERIQANLAAIACGQDVADFEGLAQGKRPSQLRAEGVDTKLVKKLKVRRRIVGTGDDAYEVEDVEFETHDRLRALELLAKLGGHLVDKQDVHHSGAIGDFDATNLTEDELMRRAHAGRVDDGLTPPGGDNA